MTGAKATNEEHGAYIDKTLTLPGAPQGPLAGLTFALKDLFDVAEHRTGFGNPQWLQTHEPATHTAVVVQSLLAAGATLRGKTHMDEMAYSLNGENAHYGTPFNPAAPGRIPGGSSSGSVVAVASGDVDFAVGSDTGGSVRVPASYCGVFGIRPTHGRVSLQHARFLAPSFCTCGWFARSAEMLRRVGDVVLLPHNDDAAMPSEQQQQQSQQQTGSSTRGASVAGTEDGGSEAPLARPTRKLRRFLVATDAFDLADPATSRAIYEALSPHLPGITARLSPPTQVALAAGMQDPSMQALADWWDIFRVAQGAEVWREHGAWVTKCEPAFGPGVRERFAMAANITPEQEAVAVQQRAQIRDHVRQLIGADGVLAIPTTPGPAPLCGTPPADLDSWRRRLISLTCIAGLAGLPQVHLPIAQVDGLPVGLGLIGPAGSDEALLELTEQLMTIIQQTR